ncbi:sulfite exporter TauE/SafE family protein [Thalassobius aquimarinus]|uniref:Probable membrane transporter protein n=2 Tax=Thalassovita aquimarina TaxID=2785917 RepID=A0ABS5HNT5_9RHOB|nr:sulfite exporter TauE/SafE family protein [Thalassovita aquimarina]
MTITELHLFPALGPWLICAFAVMLGTTIQKLSGAGFGMVAAPIMTLVAADWVPGTVLLVGFLVGAGSVLSARDAIVLKDLPPGFMGRTLGAVLAATIAAIVVGSPALPIVVACIVLFAVALNLAGLRIPINKFSLFGAGTVAGIMGTLTGIGAPPMAILYSRVETRRSAASQNAFFGFGMVVSVLALTIAGVMRWPQVAFAVSLAPLVPLSLYLSRPLTRRFERGSIRPWALGLAATAAVILLVRNF